MTRSEFDNLKIGDVVEVTIHGMNNGKLGIVREIARDDSYHGGKTYLEPINCIFEFSDMKYPRKTNKDGLYGWNRVNINYP